MKHVPRMRTVLVAGLCAAVGTAAGIGGSSAATKKHKSKASHSARSNRSGAPGRPAGLRHGRAVHAEEIVLNKAGDAFITETEDSGTVESVSGNELTIKEAVGSVTYKTVTLTIPDNATVRRNFDTAKLADLKAGDRVHVSSSSDGTFVFADDGTVRPEGGPGGPGHDGRGPGEPPPPA